MHSRMHRVISKNHCVFVRPRGGVGVSVETLRAVAHCILRSGIVLALSIRLVSPKRLYSIVQEWLGHGYDNE